VVGSAVLGAAIWAAWDKHSFIEFTQLIEDEELRTMLVNIIDSTVVNLTIYVIIVAVAFMPFASFLGYRGATRESRCFLNYYVVLLLIILLMEMAALNLGPAYAKKAEKEIKAYMKASIQQYNLTPDNGNKTAITHMWDHIMFNFQCCGVDNYTDFERIIRASPKTRRIVPDACCVVYDDDDDEKNKHNHIACVVSPNDKNSYWKKGCYNPVRPVIMERIKKTINIVIGIMSGLVLSQSLGIILAFFLCQSILIRNLKCLPAHVDQTEDGC
jgi:hypothetical protein